VYDYDYVRVTVVQWVDITLRRVLCMAVLRCWQRRVWKLVSGVVYTRSHDYTRSYTTCHVYNSYYHCSY